MEARFNSARNDYGREPSLWVYDDWIWRSVFDSQPFASLCIVLGNNQKHATLIKVFLTWDHVLELVPSHFATADFTQQMANEKACKCFFSQYRVNPSCIVPWGREAQTVPNTRILQDSQEFRLGTKQLRSEQRVSIKACVWPPKKKRKE